MNILKIILIFLSIGLLISFLVTCFICLRNRYKDNLWKSRIIIISGVINLIICGLALFLPFSFFKEEVEEIKDKSSIISSQVIFFFSIYILEIAFWVACGKKRGSVILVAGIILGSVFCFHLSLQLYAYPMAQFFPDETNDWTKALNSIVFTFQTFTLDLNFTEDFLNVVKYIGDNVNFIGKLMVVIFSIIAPATGGFVIMDILANIFPSVKLCLDCFLPWKRCYYIFSELNERSIETAESIANLKKRLSKVIIFTDVYTNSNAEDSSELNERAKKIGAICLKDDITERKLFLRTNFLKKEYFFFFIDKKEENNIKDSVALMSINNDNSLLQKNYVSNLSKHKINIYVFTQNSEAFSVINDVRKELKNVKNRKKVNNVIEKAKKKLEKINEVVQKTVLYLNSYSKDDLQKEAQNKLIKLKEIVGNILEKEKTDYLEETSKDLEKVKIGIDNVKNYLIESQKNQRSTKEKIKELKQSHKILCRITKKNDNLVKFSISCRVINEYRNLVYRLINGWEDEIEDGETSYPLYHSKKTADNNYYSICNGIAKPIQDLHICVIGSGRIGSEFIKAVYWCGQILKSPTEKNTARLHLYIYSSNAIEMQRKFKFEMPSINFCRNDKYASFHFENLEFGTKEFEEKLKKIDSKGKTQIEKFDYILIALGDDNLNYEAANWFKRSIDTQKLTKYEDTNGKIPINYIIEDKKLCDAYNRKMSNSKGKTILNAFGSLKSRYKIQNIELERFEKEALVADRTYGCIAPKLSYNEARAVFFSSQYNANSSIAVALYLPYKLYSVNRKSRMSRMDVNEVVYLESKENIKNVLYWLEHYRWVAYMRTIGYRCPTSKEINKYVGNFLKNEEILSVKNEDLKLHACMIEGNGDFKSLDELTENTDKKILDKSIEDRLNSLVENDLNLEKALKKILPNTSYDSLDRLSVLGNHNYKEYDISITLNIIKEQNAQIVSSLVEKKSFESNSIENISKIFIDQLTNNYIYKSNQSEIIYITSWNKFFLILAKIKRNNKDEATNAFIQNHRRSIKYPHGKKTFVANLIQSKKNENIYLILSKNPERIMRIDGKKIKISYRIKFDLEGEKYSLDLIDKIKLTSSSNKNINSL